MPLETRTATEGQTIGQIAAEFEGVTADDIWNLPLNAELKSKRGGTAVTDPSAVALKAGDEVKIQVPDRTVPEQKPKDEYPLDQWQKAPRMKPDDGAWIFYTAKHGDTLDKISGKDDIDADTLCVYNFGVVGRPLMNWYLRNHCGCTEPAPDYSTWVLKGGEHIWIPDPTPTPPPKDDKDDTEVATAATGVQKSRELQIALEMGLVTGGTWLPGADVWYEGSIRWRDDKHPMVTEKIGDRNQHFKIKKIPGNLFGAHTQFIKTIPIGPGMEKAPIDLRVEAWARSAGKFEKLGEVNYEYKYDDTQGWTRESIRLVPDNEKFVVYAKVDPLEDSALTASHLYASRQHRGSPEFTLFSESTVEIGLLVRGQLGENHDPSFLDQAMGSHADMTIPTKDGNHTCLVGFFGHTHIPVGKVKSGLATYIGMIAGYINKDEDFQTDREHYYDKDVAQTGGAVSLFCRLQVLPAQAAAVVEWWEKYYDACKQWNEKVHGDSRYFDLETLLGDPPFDSDGVETFGEYLAQKRGDRSPSNQTKLDLVTDWYNQRVDLVDDYQNATTEREKKNVEKAYEAHNKLVVKCREEKLKEVLGQMPDKHPLPYVLAGRNCSSRAAHSMAAGNILHHVSGVDTPFHVFRTLRKIYGARLICQAGYAGFDANHVYGIHTGYEYTGVVPERVLSSVGL